MTDTAGAARVAYSIDPVVSRFSVRVSASGMLSMLGHNPTIAARGFSGDVEVASDNFADASLKVRVDARQFAVQDSMSDRDRSEIERAIMEEVLEADRFADITFESTRVSVVPMPWIWCG